MSTIKGNFRIFKFLLIEIHWNFIRFSKKIIGIYWIAWENTSGFWIDQSSDSGPESPNRLVDIDRSALTSPSLKLHLSLLHVQGVDSRVLQRSLQRWHLSLLCFDMYPDSVKSKILFYKFRMWSILNMVVFHVFRRAKQFWPNKTLTNTTETRINRINIHSSALNGVIQAKIISFGSEYVHFRGHFG